MWIQRLIWLLGRAIFYMLMVPLLIGLIYTLATGQLRAALIFLILFLIVLYNGLVRIRIGANSVMVRDGKVVFFIAEKCVRDRFDFVSRGQTIVQLPTYGLLDRAYLIEIFTSDPKGGVSACRLSLRLGYVMDMTWLQQAYDSFVRYQDQLPLAVKRQLFKSSSELSWLSPMQGEVDDTEYLKPVIAELDRGLESLGLKIQEATCSCTAAPAMARIVTDEQVIVENPA